MKRGKKQSENKKSEVKKQFNKAKLAIKSEFYLEASWILSSMMEKKLKRILEKIENLSPGTGYSLEQFVKRVKYLHITSRYPLFSNNFEVRLIDEIRNWKNQRNAILKDMQDVHVSQARLERLALEGMRLLKEWNKAYKKFKSEFSSSAT